MDKSDVNILILGYAGGYVGKLLHAYKPQGMSINIDGVEIDPEVVNVSKQYFGVTDSERNIFIEDARSYVSRNKGKKYDIIFVDLYNKDIFIPPYLVTKEFFSDLHSMVSDDGVVAFNINSKSPNSTFLQKIHAGLRQSFTFSGQSPVENYNYLVVASDSQPNFKLTEEQFSSFPKSTHSFIKNPMPLFTLNNKNNLFTDNKNDSEILISREFVLPN